jgi:hypothetical protein
MGNEISSAVHQQMAIRGISFPHKNIHKRTRISPDGRTVSQNDHKLID